MKDQEDLFAYFVREGQYKDAVDLLRQIDDIEVRKRLCFEALVGIGAQISMDSNKLRILSDNTGMDSQPEYGTLFVDKDKMVHGIEGLIRLVPEDNPFKKYQIELELEK